MKKVLYLATFTEENHYDCVGLTRQIEDNENILCIFNNINIKNHYYKFLNDNNQYNKYSEDFAENLIDILKDHKYDYKKFVFLKSNKIILSEFRDILTNKTNISVSNNAKKFLYVLDLDNILKNFRNLKYLDLIEIENFPSIKNVKIDLELFPDIYYKTREIKHIEYKNMDGGEYQDPFCIFAFLQGFENYFDAMVFLHKRNDKIFNISNNIIGDVIYSNGSILKVSWLIDNNPIMTTHKKTDMGYLLEN